MKSHAFCCWIFLIGSLKRFFALLPMWDVLMKFVAFCCILFWWEILMSSRDISLSENDLTWRFPYEMKFYAFCCIISLRDFPMRFHAFLLLWDLRLSGSLIRVLPSDFFSGTLTLNVIGLLFLRQCLNLPPSMETLTSGTSRKLSRCKKVSQCVYWRMAWRNVTSCYCDWRVQSEVGAGADSVM